MSEYAGELKVKIVPDGTSFGPQLQQQMQGVSARTAATLERTGVGKALAAHRKAALETAAAEETLRQKEQQLAAQQAQSRQASLRNVAAFGLLAFATRNLVNDFSQWAIAQEGVVGGLGRIAQGVTNLDLVTTGKAIGETARLALDPTAGSAAADAAAAERNVQIREDAIVLAQKLLTLREQTAKAEGQVGTAAGAARYQLEQQLRIAEGQFNLLAPGVRRVAGASLGLDENLGTNSRLAARNPVQATDADRAASYQLNLLRAQSRKNEAAVLGIQQARRDALESEIKTLESATSKTTEQKQVLAGLYGQLASVETSIAATRQKALDDQRQRVSASLALAQTDLQIQAANARGQSQEVDALRAQAEFAQAESQDKRLSVQERRNYALQAAQANRQLYEIGRQQTAEAKEAAREAVRQRQEELEAEKQRYRAGLSLREQRLSIAVQAAQLTGNTTSDDRKALLAEIAFYKRESRDKKLSIQERLQYRSQEIAARLSLRGLSSTASAAASSPSDFFREAGRQFKAYGSNIAGRDGILSGQDARGAYAAKVVGSQPFAQAVAAAQAARDQARLAEARRQTRILAQIAVSVNRQGTHAPIKSSIGKARRVSKVGAG